MSCKKIYTVVCLKQTITAFLFLKIIVLYILYPCGNSFEIQVLN